MQTYGLDLRKEAADRKDTDWVFGAVSQPCLYPIPMHERDYFLPNGETQRGLEDFQDCVTRGAHNIIEAKLTYAYQRGLLKTENKRWLEQKGYINGNRVEVSDRFTAMLSGTSRNGNSLIAPLDSIHRNGCIPKSMLPRRPDMTWDMYHDKSAITQAMRDLGTEFAQRFVFNYERVYEVHFADALKDDFISVALFAWGGLSASGEYVRTENPENHVVAAFKLPKTYIFDNYVDAWDGDYVKKLAADYNFYEYGYRCYFSAEKTEAEIIATQKTLIGLLQQAVALLKRLIYA